MASSIPVFQTLIQVDQFRDLIFEKLKKEIASGEEYDQRDLQRFKQIDSYATMFLQHGQFAEQFDEDRAVRIFNASMSWRKKNHVFDITTDEFPSSYFDQHGIYFKNSDKNNHPILHFVVRKFVKGQEDNEKIKRFIIYHFERHQRRNPDQRFVILFDMSETGLKHLDYDIVKFLIGCTQTNYPGILAYMLIYKLPFILQAAWKIIRSWLPPEADQFIKFVDAKSITEFVSVDQLSTSMGGTDDTNHIHIHDPIKDAVEDPMNSNSKKKVTFADDASNDSQPVPTEPESPVTNDHPQLRNDSFSNDDSLNHEEMNSSTPTDAFNLLQRRSILQKPVVVNGNTHNENVFHNLSIRPHDELIFERTETQLNHDAVQTLILTNVGDKILTFKIKTTSPEKFRVKPGCSLLHPGASANVSVSLMKAHCNATSHINKEKFLIIWTLIGQELKQTQLTEFWKTVPNSVLYEHRLKCSFVDKSSSSKLSPSTTEAHSPVLSPSADSTLVEIQKLLKESIALQTSVQRETTTYLRQIRFLLLILFLLILLILIGAVTKDSIFSSGSKKEL